MKLPVREGASVRVKATVTESLPNVLFRVQLGSGRVLTAHVAPEFRMHVVRILPGDSVTVEVSRYDASRGRIVERR